MASKWYKIGDIETSSEPVVLTEDNISDILDSIPSVNCADKDSRDVANEEIRKFIHEQLLGEELSLDKLDLLKNKIEYKFNEATIEPGASIGLSTADAVGESSTQAALGTFHVGGAATGTLRGMEGLKTLIFLYQPNIKYNVIHTKKITKDFDETLKHGRELEGLSIGDLLEDDYQIDTFGNLGRPGWYDIYDLIYSTEFQTDDDTVILRMPLKLDKLLYFKITMEELANKINEMSYGTYENPIVRVIYSSISKATIDLHLEPDRVTSEQEALQPFFERAFFRNVVIPTFENTYIRGIPSIKKVYPVSTAVWEKSHRIVRKLYPQEAESVSTLFNNGENIDNVWYVELNPGSMEKNGIEFSELEGLIFSLGLTYKYFEESAEIIYIYNRFERGDLSSFIRERKNGVPYLKDHNIIETKIDKTIIDANVSFIWENQKIYITFDEKKMMNILYPLHKVGVSLSINKKGIVLRERRLKFSSKDSKPLERLSPYGGESDALVVKSYPLTAYPDFLEKPGDNEIIIDKLATSHQIDKNRVFFLSLNTKTYIFINNKFSDEMNYYINNNGFKLGKMVNFGVSLSSDIVLRKKADKTPDLSYMRIKASERDELKKMLKKKGLKWGDKLAITVEIENKVRFKPNDKEYDISLYEITIPDDLKSIIRDKINKSDKLESETINAFNKGSYNFSSEEMEEVDDVIMSAISSFFKSRSAARNYDHWFLSGKDKQDKTGKTHSIYRLLSNPLVDERRCYNNCLVDIVSVLGVEAGFNYFIKSFKDLNNSNYIDPRHILLIADFIFNRGKPNSVLFAGLFRQKIGHISLITIERAMEVLKKLAFVNSTENLNSMSAAISTGQLIPSGTGSQSHVRGRRIQRKILEVNQNVDSTNMSDVEIKHAINKYSKGVFESYEEEKKITVTIKHVQDQKMYDYFPELYKDVINKFTDKYLELNSDGVGEILPIPQKSISKMTTPIGVNNVLGSPAQVLPKKKPPPESTAVLLNSKLAERKRRLPAKSIVKKDVKPVQRKKHNIIDVSEFIRIMSYEV